MVPAAGGGPSAGAGAVDASAGGVGGARYLAGSATNFALQPALQKYRPEEWRPGVQYQTDEELARLAGDIATTIFHPVGTTKMGRDDDPMAVLDSRLRVRGVAGLRVVLWDKDRGTIVSNESSEIIRMFDSAFDALTGSRVHYWPEDLRPAIEAVNERVYPDFNNGVYWAGFASTQAAYDEAAPRVFETMAWADDVLSRQRYLTGARLTEADWRMFTSAVRFDTVYHTHFRCNRAWLRDYPNLWGWTRELYQMPGIAATVRQDHIVNHYYRSHPDLNPFGIIPINPVIDWDAPHGRG